jgi:hypothetical protein
VIKTLEAQVGQFLLGCKCPVSRFLPGRAVDLSEPLYVYLYQFEQICITEMSVWIMVSVKMRVCINWLSLVVQHKAFALISAFQPEVRNVEPWQEYAQCFCIMVPCHYFL